MFESNHSYQSTSMFVVVFFACICDHETQPFLGDTDTCSTVTMLELLNVVGCGMYPIKFCDQLEQRAVQETSASVMGYIHQMELVTEQYSRTRIVCQASHLVPEIVNVCFSRKEVPKCSRNCDLLGLAIHPNKWRSNTLFGVSKHSPLNHETMGECVVLRFCGIWLSKGWTLLVRHVPWPVRRCETPRELSTLRQVNKDGEEEIFFILPRGWGAWKVNWCKLKNTHTHTYIYIYVLYYTHAHIYI